MIFVVALDLIQAQVADGKLSRLNQIDSENTQNCLCAICGNDTFGYCRSFRATDWIHRPVGWR